MKKHVKPNSLHVIQQESKYPNNSISTYLPIVTSPMDTAMDTAMETAPAPSPPKDPPARLPRAGTFRQRRPMSTGPAGLRRGSTFANRPQSFAATQSFKLPEPESPDPVPPRLRRASSFFSQTEQDDSHVVLRGASRLASEADPPLRRSIRHNDTKTPPRSSLRRAGTFAFGASLSSPQLDSSEPVQTVPTPDKQRRAAQSCGMCSSCGTGSKAMPPWAPERMSRMTHQEKEEVLRELHHKEEMGRLEAELRKKRVEEMQALSARLQVKHSLREDSDDYSANSAEDVAKADDQYPLYELESVDLGDDVQRKDQTRHRGRRRSTSTTSRSTQDNMEDLVTRVDVAEPISTPRVVDRCGECDDLERKVKDLEEELAVLQEVVKICEENEAAERQEEADDARRNHGKGWMGKIASAYYGSSAAGNEKTRLKEEVEALRRATDFLFQKMQTSSK